jgi:hypothetical protein
MRKLDSIRFSLGLRGSFSVKITNPPHSFTPSLPLAVDMKGNTQSTKISAAT